MQAYPHTRCIHDLFCEQAARTPQAVALSAGATHTTYRQLDDATNQLAARLRQLGVGPEVVVACYLNNPAQVVRYMLAILKAGGMYLLLDRHLPDERLRYMVQDARPKLVLRAGTLPAAVAGAAHSVVSIQALEAAAAELPATPLPSLTQPHNAAYIAYTSGSTGRPKGVVITHQATVNHAWAFAHLFKLSPHDRVPLMAPAAFDMATEEMVPPLLFGCQLVASHSDHTGMPEFTNEIAQQHYTILNLPAPLWQQWTEYLADNHVPVPPSVRLVIAGSDKLYTASLKEWLGLPGADRVQWAAAYGTTETTVTSGFWLCEGPKSLPAETLVPIGQPIANTAFYILDAEGKPMPSGHTGELVIGGHGLARGYHNLPQKTAAAFVPDPFWDEPGARMYKTGDLARRLPNGDVLCLGRRDHQIKMNGLRIELGEIEGVLAGYPHVNDAVVIVRQGTAGTPPVLIAFVEPRAGHSVAAAALLAYAKDRLHPFMVPAHVVVQPHLPLNANGKLDRKALEQYTFSDV